jgi:hypothetical protein
MADAEDSLIIRIRPSWANLGEFHQVEAPLDEEWVKCALSQFANLKSKI